MATLPTMWAVVTGHASIGYLYGAALPSWTWWHSISTTGAPLVVGGLLCGLLLATGRTPARALAAVAAAWFVAATATLASSYWNARIANSGDATPLSIQVVGHGLVLATLGIAAIVTSRKSVSKTPTGLGVDGEDATRGSG